MSIRQPINIVVRPFKRTDADSFLAAVMASVTELAPWMPWCTPDYGLEEARAWMEFCEAAWHEKSEFPLGIFDPSTGQVIGGTGINQINRIHRVGNIGYWVSRPFIGRGVATEAARRSAVLGFTELGFRRLEIVTQMDNLASQRVASRVGAVREGVVRNRLQIEGRSHDAVMFSLIPSDLEKHGGGNGDAREVDARLKQRRSGV